MWIDEDFPFVFTEKAKTFIKDHRENPFFLYFSFHDIHVPRLPNERFQGKSSMGPRGDAIVQMDWMTGEILNELERLGLDNTLVIFTSDNGPVLDDGYDDKAEELLGDHKPAGPFRGGKYSAFEAGTRVPMIAYWTGKTASGKSNALISQTDLYASFAELLNVELGAQEARDSQNVLPALLDASEKGNDIILEESMTLSIRKGDWKYIAPLKKKNTPLWLNDKKIEMGYAPNPQLFNLLADPGELNNIAEQHPELVAELQAKIDSIIQL